MNINEYIYAVTIVVDVVASRHGNGLSEVSYCKTSCH